MEPLRPKDVRYIKLGQKGGWAKRSFGEAEIHLGFSSVPHRLCRDGDWEAVFRLLKRGGKSASTARRNAREIKDFYTLGPDSLWITFADGHLYWAFAAPKVIWLGGSSSTRGSRMRRVIGRWHHKTIAGEPLRTDVLSSRLTKVAAFRGTICRVEAEESLLRRLNGIEEPLLRQAKSAGGQMQQAVEKMVAGLHWADFETLVDLIFARSGWQRVARVGGRQKDVDLQLYQPVSGESAFVQVKSRADQAVLDDYIERFDAGGLDRMFFICHSPVGKLTTRGRKRVHLWLRAELGQMAFKAGLFDWLVDKVG